MYAVISAPVQREQLLPTAPPVSVVPVKPKRWRRLSRPSVSGVDQPVTVDVELGERRQREALREHAVGVAVLGSSLYQAITKSPSLSKSITGHVLSVEAYVFAWNSGPNAPLPRTRRANTPFSRRPGAALPGDDEVAVSSEATRGYR